MRWDGLISGLQSLWESEEENAELDERREVLRSDRARLPFIQVLCERARRHSVVATIDGLARSVHISVLGASWCEGAMCGSGEVVVVPIHRVQSVSEAGSCGCPLLMANVIEHATMGSKLRALERSGASVTAVCETGGVRGRVTAVWKDAVDVTAGTATFSLSVAAIVALVVERS